MARVSIRQATAHPVSEFLGTVMLMIVLCVGGMMIINGKSFIGGGKFIDAPTFIYFLVILYSVIEPIKELSRATYSVRKVHWCILILHQIKLAVYITLPDNILWHCCRGWELQGCTVVIIVLLSCCGSCCSRICGSCGTTFCRLCKCHASCQQSSCYYD